MSTMPEVKPAAAQGAPDASGDAARKQRVGSPAVDALRRTVAMALTELFGGFVRRLPADLAQRAQVSQNPADQRACTDLAQLLSPGPERWIADFIRRVDTRLIGAAKTGEDTANHAGVGDVLLLTRPELVAETQYAALITDLDARMEHVRRSVYFPIRAGALAPADLCHALQDTAAAMNCTGASLRVLFERFDEQVLPLLPRLYRTLFEALSDIEARAAEAQSLLQRETARAEVLRSTPPSVAPVAPAAKPPPTQAKSQVAAPKPAPTAAAQAAAAPARKIDDKTRSMLESVLAKGPAEGEDYSDSSLAGDLLALQGQAPLAGGPDIAPERRWVPLQRISLAGQFLNEATADPLVPQELGPQHESVRFPLVKSALTDATLFTALTHPLRSLVNELMLKAATSRITGTVEARQMAEVLQQVLVQFDLAPDFVREAMLTAQPINEQQISGFFESQKKQALQRKEAVIHEAKRLVVRELELRTFGRPVPQQAIKFLNTSWGPLLVKGLLQHGADNAHWRDGIDRMEKMLDELELCDGEMPPPQSWQDLVGSMGRDLTAGGMSAERVKEALALLDAAWQAPKQRLPF